MKGIEVMLSLFVLLLVSFPNVNSSICCEDIRSEVEEKELAYQKLCSTVTSDLEKCCHDLDSYVERQRKAYETLCPELDEFHANFTSLGASGRLGPTSLGSYYVGKDNENMVTLQNGTQLWTVPYTGTYEITAVGAAGGYDLYSKPEARGRGAYMKGEFDLKKGQQIKIVVGQEGVKNPEDLSAGGGGGSFVASPSDVPLIVAGGGGGSNQLDARWKNCDASTGKSGRQNYCKEKKICSIWPGGVNGSGALEADDENSGGGGGGFFSNGWSSERFGGVYGFGGEGGRGFIQGAVGGRALYYKTDGGFGGGGGAIGLEGGAAGGGGYSGGAPANNDAPSCGGGGGSYNIGKNQENKGGFWKNGDGYVEIRLLL